MGGRFMDWAAEFDQKIADYLPDVRIAPEEPMANHTSFRIGGPARRMAFPKNGEQLVLLLEFARESGARPLVIGNGTNLLVPDAGLDRLVIETSGLNRLEMADGSCRILAGAGVPLSRLAVFAARQGLTGLEFAHGIPGSVGGAVCMNAGAYGGEIRQVVTGVSALFPEEGVRSLNTEALDFGYRHSLFSDCAEAVVLHAVFSLSPGDQEDIQAKMRELMQKRRERQPLEYPSAGSTFKRPEGRYAGTLIEQCGLKGLTVGGAQVSEKHAGFVINRCGATFADVMSLICKVQEQVYEKTGVHLEPEVRIVR